MRQYKDVFLIDQPAVAITATPTAPSRDLYVGDVEILSVDVNVSIITGAGAGYTIAVERKGIDGIYYPIWTSASITAVGSVSANLGVGASTNVMLGKTIRVRETVVGTTPNIDRSVSIVGLLAKDCK